MIKGAIFDVDGTLLATMSMWYGAGKNYLAKFGLESTREVDDKLFCMSLPEGAQYLWETYDFASKGVSADDVREGIKAPAVEYYKSVAQPKPGARELLAEMSEAGIPIAIVTSSDRQDVEVALERLDMMKYIGRIFSATEVGRPKSDPYIFNLAAEFLKASPRDIWVFEDGLYAIRTANEAGFNTAGVYDYVSRSNWGDIQKETVVSGYDLSHISLGDIRRIHRERPACLTIAGSDSSGGAGIQADIKTMMANGVYAMSAVTALTAQNTCGVRSIQESTPEFLSDQLDCVFTDIFPAAVKIGMVSSVPLINVIADKLAHYGAKNIVVDPVMVATAGSKLMMDGAAAVMAERLFPLASVITPNIPETEALTGLEIKTEADMEKAGRVLCEKYGCAVLIKGGHRVSDANDVLCEGDRCVWIRGRRIDNPNTHGTGCTLSSAIASGLAKGCSLEEAVRRAKDYISGALAAKLDLGAGSGPMDHGFDIDGEFCE